MWNQGSGGTPSFAPNSGGGNQNSMQYQSSDPRRVSGDLMSRLRPLWIDRIKMMTDNQELYRNLFNRAKQMMMNTSRQSDINKYNRQMMEDFGNNARNTAALLRSQGVNDVGGLSVDAMNQANAATGAYANEQLSPDSEMERMMQLFALLNEVPGQGFDLFSLLAGANQPKPPGDPLGGWGGIIGEVLGAVL